MAAVPLPVGEGNLLLLPDPVEAVLNHVPIVHDHDPDQPPAASRANLEASKVAKSPASLEDICVMAYLKYLENEIVTYISLTQSKSHLVKGVAKKMLQVWHFHNYNFQIKFLHFQTDCESYLTFRFWKMT